MQYNNAFENALIDTYSLFWTGNAKTILVGNAEEITDFNFNIDSLAGKYKAEETTSENLLTSGTKGTI